MQLSCLANKLNIQAATTPSPFLEAQAPPGLGAVRGPLLGPRQGALQVLDVGQGVPQGPRGFQGRDERAALGGHDRGGLDPDVHPDAYQQPPASLLTVTFSIRARPRTSRRRSLAWARHGAARATHPYLATRIRPGCSCSPPAVVNLGRSRWRALNLGNRDWPFRKLVCAVCAARMPYRNAQTDWPPCHGAATLLVASQRRTRSKYDRGRVRSPLGMS